MTIDSRGQKMAVLPMPEGYRLLQEGEDGGKWVRKRDKMIVILSKAVENDGRVWYHISCSFVHRVPTFAEVREMKQDFLGDRYAAMVFPPEEYYVNINPNVLHVFALEDRDAEWVMPEFTRGLGTL